MGPHGDQGQALAELREFRKKHPEVIVTYPSDTPAGLWEVSVPETSRIAFDSVATMMRTLNALYPDDEVAQAPEK